jgi:cysteine sulfinate desulfinase/cysteine desulfurase-like protein/rhodanese-related sulfurtransferase
MDGLIMTSAHRRTSLTHPLQTTVYLDCNATTHTHPLALQAAREAMELCFGNPSSTHITGLHAKSFLESAREAAAQAVGATGADEIIFNSGATEGIQSSVFSVLIGLLSEFREHGRLRRWRILYGSTEHKAVPAAIEHWSELLRVPVSIEAIPVDDKGLADLEFIGERLAQTALICTMAVNNETGVIQPLDKISALLSSPDGAQCLWFVDGVQALGKINLDLKSLGAHYACFSGHKLNAPKGIGFLWVRGDAPYTPMIVGGGQERGKRSGTENLPGAAAFGRILRAVNDTENSIFLTHSQLENCRQKLIRTLTQCFPTLVWNADLRHCVATTLNFSVEGISGRELMNAFDAAGVRVSGGSACSSGKTTGSHVLTAMNLPKWRAQNAIRLSFGPASTEMDIDSACEAICSAGEALRASCMIPNLPARANQMTDMIPLDNQGVSELRSSDGTRAWLVISGPDQSYLVADCEGALLELKGKLACRGLVHSQILRLDAPPQQHGLPSGWTQLQSTSGTSLLFEFPAHAGSELTAAHSALLFAPFRDCLAELMKSKHAANLSGKTLLACYACEPTALTAYEFKASRTSVQGASASEKEPPIECAKEELARRLRDQHFTVLDVREPFETATSHLDDILNQLLTTEDRKAAGSRSNMSFAVVPLSRLPQFIIERLASPRQEKILCVCRSGQRSLQAAELLRKIEGCDAYSLKGGVADLLAPDVSLPPRSAIYAGHDK